MKQRLEYKIRKNKELLETKKRVNEFKLKQMRILNEREAEGDDAIGDAGDDLNARIGEFDPRGNDQMIKTSHGMQVRFQPR